MGMGWEYNPMSSRPIAIPIINSPGGVEKITCVWKCSWRQTFTTMLWYFAWLHKKSMPICSIFLALFFSKASICGYGMSVCKCIAVRSRCWVLLIWISIQLCSVLKYENLDYFYICFVCLTVKKIHPCDW